MEPNAPQADGCQTCARLRARIEALEAKILHQHALLTHLWNARDHGHYIRCNHSTRLGTGQVAARRLDVLAALPADRWVWPCEIKPGREAVGDLHCLVAIGYAERRARAAPTAGVRGRTPRDAYEYRRTHAGTTGLLAGRTE